MTLSIRKMAMAAAALVAFGSPILTAASSDVKPERPAPWLVAQAERAVTCEKDGRKVPSGSLMCRQGTRWRCSTRGAWENTAKRC